MTYLNREWKNTKNKFNTLFVLLVLMAVLTLSACKPVVVAPSYQPSSVLPDEAYGMVYGKRLYLTSIGQALDIETLAANLDHYPEISYIMDNELYASEVESGSVVFIAVGCSFKALTESGLTKQSETERAEEFIRRANNGEISIVSWHIGGVARRGSTSDSLIELLFKNSQLALFTAAGNNDLFLSDWAIEADVPYCQFGTSIVEVIECMTEKVK